MAKLFVSAALFTLLLCFSMIPLRNLQDSQNSQNSQDSQDSYDSNKYYEEFFKSLDNKNKESMSLITDIKANSEFVDTIEEAYEYKHYKLILPPANDNSKKNLFFFLDIVDANFRKIVYPHIFISTENNQPKNELDSNYYSNGNGAKSITIEDIYNISGFKSTYYISIYCNSNCKFKLQNRLSLFFDLVLGEKYNVYLKKDTPLFFRFNNLDSRNLEFFAFSKNREDFEFLVAADSLPNENNHIEVIPGIYNSVRVNDFKDKIALEYFIRLRSIFDEEQEISIGVVDTSETLKMKNGQNYFGSVSKNDNYCYELEINEDRFNFKNDPFSSIDHTEEEIIIENSIFSGDIQLLIAYEKEHFTSEKFDLSYEVHSHKIIKVRLQDILQKKPIMKEPEKEEETVDPRDRPDDYVWDLLYNHEHNFEKPKSSNNSKSLYVCVKGKENSSYLLKYYFMTQYDQIQNYLIKNIHISSFLPKYGIGRYEVLENKYFYDTLGDIKFNLDVIYGNVEMNLFFCEVKNCKLNLTELEQMKDLVVPSTHLTNTSQEIFIEDKYNYCTHKLYSSDEMCRIFIIVKCGDSECSFKLNYTQDETLKILNPRTPFTKSIENQNVDYYLVDIKEDVKSFSVIVNSINGRTSLLHLKLPIKDYSINSDKIVKEVLTKENKDLIDDQIIKSRSNGNQLPDVLVFNENQKGLYLIAVYGETYSTYHISYYTVKNEQEDHISHVIPLNYFIKDYFHSSKFRIYVVTIPKSNYPKPLRINLTPERGVYKIYAKLNKNFEIGQSFEEDTFSIKDFDFESTENNEIIIDHPSSNEYSIYILVARRDYLKEFLEMYGKNHDHREFLFYIGVNQEGSPFILPDSIPYDITLTRDFSTQLYVHMIDDKEKIKHVNIINYSSKINIFITFDQEKLTNYLIHKSNDIIVFKDVLSKVIPVTPQCIEGEPHCKMFVYIELTDSIKINNSSQFVISIKDQVDLDERLIDGLKKFENINIGEKHYYYAFLKGKKTGGRIEALFDNSFSSIYVKLIPFSTYTKNSSFSEKDYPNKDSADFVSDIKGLRNMILLSGDSIFECGDHCVVLITVHSKPIFESYENYESNFSTYEISFSTSFLRLALEQLTQGDISSKEIQYFQLFIPERIRFFSVYLNSISGDSNLYINKGLNPPLTYKYDFKSSSSKNLEIISVDISNTFFSNANLSDVSGIYTIGVFGNISGHFSLVPSLNKKNVYLISDEASSTCIVETQYESCLFEYDLSSLIEKDKNGKYMLKVDEKDVLKIVFYFEKIYGDFDILLQKRFSNSNDIPINLDVTDMSADIIEKDKEYIVFNYVVNNQFLYSYKPSILIKARNKKDSLFVRLKTTKSVIKNNSEQSIFYENNELLLNEEKLGYISKQSTTIIYHFNTLSSNVILNFRKIKGKGKILIEGKNYGIENERHTINLDLTSKGFSKSLNIEVSSLSTELDIPFIYSLELSIPKNWIMLNPNKELKISIPKHETYIYYFPIYLEYESIYFNFVERCKQIGQSGSGKLVENSSIMVYFKYAIVNDSEDDFLNKIKIPEYWNSDFAEHLNEITKTIGLSIPGISKKLDNSAKKVYLLISVNNLTNEETDSVLRLTPTVKGLTITETYPNTAVNGNVIIEKNFKIDKNTKVYALSYFSPKELVENDDDPRIIDVEISTCNGEIEVALSEDKNYYSTKAKLLIQKNVITENTILSVTSSKKVYMFINGIKGNADRNCKIGLNEEMQNDNLECQDIEKIEFLFNYSVIRPEDHKDLNTNGVLEYTENKYNNKITLRWEGMESYEYDRHRYSLAKEMIYFIYSFNKYEDFEKMKSTCFLSQKKPRFFTEEKSNDLTVKEQLKKSKSEKMKVDQDYYSLVFDIEYNNLVFMNVVGHSKLTGLNYCYNPQKIYIEKSIYNFTNITIFITCLLIIVSLVVYSFYRKYKIAVIALAMEIDDKKNEPQDEILDSSTSSRANYKENIEMSDISISDSKKAKEMITEISNEIAKKNADYSDLELSN